MKDVMLDLETMGNGNNAAIIAIGAVEFDLENALIGRKFYAQVNLESAVKEGGIIDASTVLWWMKQSDAARKEFENAGIPVIHALAAFSQWFPEGANVWGNGATFDNVILRNTYTRLDWTTPWSFRQDRCFRTVRALHPLAVIPNVGTAHNAVNDAEYQARYLIKILTEEAP